MHAGSERRQAAEAQQLLPPRLAPSSPRGEAPGDFHFHDLRQTGNHFAADEGANLRELMDRIGHSTTRTARAYLHGSDERQQVIADALSSRVAAELGRSETRPSGHEAGTAAGRAS